MRRLHGGEGEIRTLGTGLRLSDDVWQDQCETRLTSQRFSGARAKPLLTVR